MDILRFSGAFYVLKSIFKSEYSDTDRLEMFSDGVFAIVITLLVLEIRVPDISSSVTSSQFVYALIQLWPKFYVFILSFAVIYIIWMNHHQTFNMIIKSNRALMMLNGLLLFFTVLVPFPTALVGEYPFQPAASIIYGAVMALLAFSHLILYRYITKNRLIDESIPQDVVEKGFERALIGPLVYATGAICALIFIPASYIIYTLITIYYLFPGSTK
jgi:uncharacterized membrane protein